jgi:hypothetical protein
MICSFLDKGGRLRSCWQLQLIVVHDKKMHSLIRRASVWYRLKIPGAANFIQAQEFLWWCFDVKRGDDKGGINRRMRRGLKGNFELSGIFIYLLVDGIYK